MVAGATLTSENFGRLLYETRVRAMGHSVVTRADAQSPRIEHGEEEEARLQPSSKCSVELSFLEVHHNGALSVPEMLHLAVTGIACMSKAAAVIPGISRIQNGFYRR